MKKSKILSMILAIVMVMSLLPVITLPVNAADNVIYVDTTKTSGNYDGSSWDNAYTDLQDALGAAQSGDQIWVAAGTYYPTVYVDDDSRTESFMLIDGVAIYGGFAGDETTFADRDITANITILSGDIGAEDDIDDNSYHVVYSDDSVGNTAVIDGFTVTGGNASSSGDNGNGGGMFNYGSPTIANCIFTENTAINGGGMYNAGSDSTVINCTFNQNTIILSNGKGGGMYNENGNLTISGCTFSENAADYYGGSFGGGMYNENSSLVISDCTFSDNIANVGGGMYNEGCSLTITDCIFDGNTVIDNYGGGNGGGMFNYDSSLMIIGCTFIENTAVEHGGGMFSCSYNDNDSLIIIDCIFNKNIAGAGGDYGDGGGMLTVNFSPTISNCTFTENEAEWGGGIYNDYHSDSQILNCTFIGNIAVTGFGGGMGNNTNAPTILGCTFNENISNGNGNGIYDYDSTPIISHCIIADDIYGDAPTITNSLIHDGTQWTGQSPTLTIADVVNSDGTIPEGSIAIDSGDTAAWQTIWTTIWTTLGPKLETAGIITDASLYDDVSDLTDIIGNPRVDGSEIDIGAFEGGVYVPRILYVDLTKTSGDNDGTDWDNAYTDLQDAIAYSQTGDQIWVAAGTYYPGTARTDSFTLIDGVALYGGFAGDETDFDDRDFTANVTILSGDIGVEDDITDNSYHVVYSDDSVGNTACFDGFTITGGNANGSGVEYYDDTSNGGGMLNEGSSKVANCTFIGNATINDGGGMLNDNSYSVITNCIFTENTATFVGGGMYNQDGKPQIIDCTFTENTAVHGGGMFNAESSPTISNCVFSTNTASTDGGGISNSYYSTPTVTNCTFTENTANSTGGGIHNYESNPTISNCTFIGNISQYGGGIMNRYISRPIISGCTFISNTAIHSGGGIYNSGSAATVLGCTFTGNLAGNYGGGMSSDLTSPAVINCVFSGNIASYGGGMYELSASSIVFGCTFTGNTATESGSGIYHFGDGNPFISHSIIDGTVEGGAPEYSYSIIGDIKYGEDNDDTSTCVISDVINADGTLKDGGIGAIDGGYTAYWQYFWDIIWNVIGPQLETAGIITDAGDYASIGDLTDILGNPRVDGTIDIGAFEGVSSISDVETGVMTVTAKTESGTPITNGDIYTGSEDIILTVSVDVTPEDITRGFMQPLIVGCYSPVFGIGLDDSETPVIPVFGGEITLSDEDRYKTVDIWMNFMGIPESQKYSFNVSLPKLTTPTAVIDYANETLTGLTANAKYTLGGVEYTADANGKIAIIEAMMTGTAVNLIAVGDNATSSDSDAQSVTIPTRPAAPTGVDNTHETFRGLDDGTLTGVSSDMEYKKSDGEWTDISGETVKNLTPGDYVVRLKATATAFVSLETGVLTIEASLFSVTIETVIFDEVTYGYAQPAAKNITIINNHNIAADIISVEVDSEDFIIAGSGDNIPASESISTWTIQPVTGLSAGTHTSIITVTFDASEGQETIATHVTITINKADPQFTVPTDLTAEAGQTLSDTIFESQPANGEFSWVNPNENVGNTAGIFTFKAKFTPTDTVNYTTVTNINVDVNVLISAAIDGSITIVSGNSQSAYTNAPFANPLKVVVKDADGNVLPNITVTFNANGITFEGNINTAITDANGIATSKTITAGGSVGTVTVTATANGFTSASFTLTVNTTPGNDGGGGGIISESKLTVKFETNGGSIIGDQTINVLAKVVKPADPTKEGFTFDGWYIDKEFKTEFNFNSAVIADMILYAKWTEKTEEETEPEDIPDDINEWENPFTDVNKTDWFYDDVKFAFISGLFNGTSENTFDPNISMTRAMLVTVLWRNAGSPKPLTEMIFTDIPEDSYYYDAVIWAAENGIVNGIGEGLFAPNGNITREQMATMLWRYAQYMDLDVASGETADISGFVDVNDISEYAVSALKWAYAEGIINGRPGGILDPKGNATRAEVAAMLHRFLTGIEIEQEQEQEQITE